MRTDDLYLSDILKAVRATEVMTAGYDLEAFINDELIRSAVMYQFIIIGEAATQVSRELRERHPDVPWRQARGLRNYAAHVYFAIDWDQIWGTIIQDLPHLAAQILAIVAAEFPDLLDDDGGIKVPT
jgi:uncharacterized protein with HEPN domain